MFAAENSMMRSTYAAQSHRDKRRKRPRRLLLVPSSSSSSDKSDSRDDKDHDAYYEEQVNADQFLSVGVRGIKRPLIPLTTLAAMHATHVARTLQDGPAASSSASASASAGGDADGAGDKDNIVKDVTTTTMMMPLLKSFVESIRQNERNLSNHEEDKQGQTWTQPDESLPISSINEDEQAVGKDKASGVNEINMAASTTPTDHVPKKLEKNDANREKGEHIETSNTAGMETSHKSHSTQTLSPPPTSTSTTTTATLVDDIDDPSKSTLTRGQHVRYKQLRYEFTKATRRQPIGTTTKTLQKQKEFRKLAATIKEERKLYAQALLQFRDRYKERFMIGFKVPGPASKFVHFNSHLVSQYQKRWFGTNNDSPTEKRPPTKYGKCIQSISLHKYSASAASGGGAAMSESRSTGGTDANYRLKGGMSNATNWPRLDVHSFASQVVHSTSSSIDEGLSCKVRPGWIQCCSPDSPLPLSPPPPPAAVAASVEASEDSLPSLICDDEMAKKLATKHGAAVVMSHRAFEALLHRPGHEETRWKIPVTIEQPNETKPSSKKMTTTTSPSSSSPLSASKRIAFVEEPIPQPSTPRECLSRGFEAALYHTLSSLNTSSSSETATKATVKNVQYVYTLLTIPSSITSQQQQQQQQHRHPPFRVLVRTEKHRHESLLDENDNPIHLHAQLEYFPERGWEVCTHHQRTLWIVDKLLQPRCRVVVGRIDPNTACLLRLEEKGVAHALTGDDDEEEGDERENGEEEWDRPGNDGNRVSAHFGAACELLRATAEKIGAGQYALCLPGVPEKGDPPAVLSASLMASVSVHGACSDSRGADSPSSPLASGKPPASSSSCSSSSSVVVDIKQELDSADAVYMNGAALMSCFRNWVWDHDRISFTFPISEGEEKTTKERVNE